MARRMVFLIRPVRNCSPEFAEKLAAYVRGLEAQGYTVYDPLRDTPQDDPVGLAICRINRTVIDLADEVHFTWDGKSQGCLFDLGMAFALCKKVVAVEGLLPPDAEGKSFSKMARAYAQHWGEDS